MTYKIVKVMNVGGPNPIMVQELNISDPKIYEIFDDIRDLHSWHHPRGDKFFICKCGERGEYSPWHHLDHMKLQAMLEMTP